MADGHLSSRDIRPLDIDIDGAGMATPDAGLAWRAPSRSTGEMPMSTETLKVEIEGKVATVTMNRPASKNSVNGELHTALTRVFIDLSARRDLHAIVLTGAGESFCSGGDISWMRDSLQDPEVFEFVTWEAKRIVYSMLECDIPIIGRINGDAVGLGATLALLCDITIASDTARIGDPHVRAGLNAADGGGFLWPLAVGIVRARELLLTGDLLTAEEAHRMGALNHVVPAAELDAKVDHIVGKMVRGPLKAQRWTKAGYTIPIRQQAHAHMDAGIAYELLASMTRDHKLAIDAFIDKRKPEFEGGWPESVEG
jgi:enoyl-CoA hydratase